MHEVKTATVSDGKVKLGGNVLLDGKEMPVLAIYRQGRYLWIEVPGLLEGGHLGSRGTLFYSMKFKVTK